MKDENNKKVPWIANIGGIFLYSKQAKNLSLWYQKVFGISLKLSPDNTTYYTDFPYENGQFYFCFAIVQTPESVKNPMPFMVSYRLTNIDAFLEHLESLNIEVTDTQEDPSGLFAWFEDPDGNQVEVWQPYEK